jgi:hypothetical protein
MKTLLFSILFLFSFCSLNSQIPFAPVGARYYTKTDCFDPANNSFDLYEVKEDSVIQGKYCTFLYSGIINSLGLNSQEVYVYQEGDRVFIYDKELETFHLVYDFSKIEGEKYKIYMNEYWFDTDSATVEVINIDTVLIGSVQGVRQELRVTNDNDMAWLWTSFETIIYEGIGGIFGNRMLIPQWLIIAWDCGISEQCYWSKTTGEVALGGSSQPCIPVYAEDLIKQNYFNVYPNPSSGDVFLNYDLPEKFKETDVRIFDSTGSLYELFELNNHFGKINIEDLPTGFYYIIMTAQGRIIGTDKLIVVN